MEPVERNVMLVGPSASFSMDKVTEALGTVYDPEIPISIVELGLVYRCDEVELPDGRRRIEIDMTMTAPGCGMGDVLRADAMRAVSAVPGVDEVEVTVVWEPPWSMDRISEEARLELGLL
jgi:metal-sulfur cluster biosynthetic enzyme